MIVPESPSILTTATPKVSILTRLARLVRMSTHIAHGFYILAIRYPHLANAERAVITRAWARKMLSIFGVEVKISGNNPGFYPPNTLLVANHVSWLDIIALSSGTVSRFVAKKEIGDWPIVGTMAKNGGTLFIDRSNRRDASRINGQLAEALTQGGCMSVFPEGTTSDGFGLLPFKASLFESALLAKSRVQPVAIRYLDANGKQTAAISYVGDHTFGQILKRLLAMKKLVVELHYGQILQAGAEPLATRFQLSAAARREILSGLNLSDDTQDTAAQTPACPLAVTQ
ncbi:lysophospholipid acyltransferase family protein [Craterilacuibacter sp.]|uniref:lysophospholipid acyltransferase family protein n=1 Tax=Craterilacuibacter sp. TaxID=2870909 RepID=UPI003F3B1C64